MICFNSQEQTIYRCLTREIQLGFYGDGAPFPSLLEIAQRFHVSYCPAQRALKAMEADGLIKLRRGQPTELSAKPYENYLQTDTFHRCSAAIADLIESLPLLSPAFCCQGLYQMQNGVNRSDFLTDASLTHPVKRLYRLFEHALCALNSQTIMSLYYDISAFCQSAFIDIFHTADGRQETERFLLSLSDILLQSAEDCRQDDPARAFTQLEKAGTIFADRLKQHFDGACILPATVFTWEPHKGRTKYCDIIATDLVCKIHQGKYPVGARLPNNAVLADTYHVSGITIRRTIQLLNRLGVTITKNGIGTQVIFEGDASLLHKIKDLMLDENLKSFLESLHLLAITCGSVIRYTFPYITEEFWTAISNAARHKEEKKAMTETISACMQAIVHCCPLAAIREIYSKVTLMLLKGSVLRLAETGREPVPGWAVLSDGFQSSLAKRDGARFAMTFERLCESSFAATRELLIKNGVSGAEQLAVPVSLRRAR